MIALALTLTLAGAGATDEGLPFFTRVEPSLEAAFEALAADDPDLAIERIHDAAADDDDERAIVEYDVGQALIARARKDVVDAAAANPKEPKPKAPPKLDDALQSFERAAALARDPRIVSESHLAVGNAHLEMQKIDEAIAAYRRAVVADLQNERARRNLQRALELKGQQPPPQEDQQQQSGDGEGDDKKQDPEQKNDDGEKGDEQQKQDGDQQGKEQQQDGEDKGHDAQQRDDEQNDGDKNKPQKDADAKDKKDGEKDDPASAAAQQKQDEQQKKQEEEQQKKAAAAKKKPTSKEEAKRLLQGLRSRERPLSPLEMRGVEPQRPKDGKDW